MQSQTKSDSISDKALPDSPEPERAIARSHLNKNSQAEAERRLLEFVGELIIDIAHTHPRVREVDVALWVARIAVGGKQ